MPYTEADMSHADMKEAVRNGKLCRQCQSGLTVAWGGNKYDCWILRCGNNIEHTGITGHDTAYENKIREAVSMDSTALMTMGEQAMMARVNLARFPQELTQQDKILLAQAAITYGFDPIMKEITIYQGQLFISIDGRYRKAQETGKLDGVDTRPATKQEREDWQIPDGDYFFRSEVFVKEASRPFVGWGRVRKAETLGGKGFKPVETNPQRMAEKRAEAQALRKAFHIPLPSIEEIGAPGFDVEGEVVEKKQTIEPPKQEQPKTEQPEKPPVVINKGKQPSADAGLVKNDGLSGFLKWTMSHGNQYGSEWVCSVLELKSINDLKDFDLARKNLIELTGWNQ